MIFLLKISLMSVFLHVARDFSYYGANNLYNADEIFVKSSLWSNKNKLPLSVLLLLLEA